jgi:cation transport regulator ChaB
MMLARENPELPHVLRVVAELVDAVAFREDLAEIVERFGDKMRRRGDTSMEAIQGLGEAEEAAKVASHTISVLAKRVSTSDLQLAREAGLLDDELLRRLTLLKRELALEAGIAEPVQSELER